MEVSGSAKVSSSLPRLSNRVPGQDGAEFDAMIETSGDEEEITDQGGSQSGIWLRKISTLNLPPLQLAAVGIDCHLIVSICLTANI